MIRDLDLLHRRDRRPDGRDAVHFNLVAHVVQTGAVEPIESDEVLVGLMPFCQLYGMVTVNLGLAAGATIVTLPHFTLPNLMTAMARLFESSTWRLYLPGPRPRLNPSPTFPETFALKNI